MKKFAILFVFTILCQNTTAKNVYSALACSTDTNKQKLIKLEFITDKYDTVIYTLNQDKLFYTIRKVDILIDHIPPKILDALKSSVVSLIYLYVNEQKFSAKPNPFFSSGVPDSDYFFPVDNKGGIIFWRTGSINFIKIQPDR